MSVLEQAKDRVHAGKDFSRSFKSLCGLKMLRPCLIPFLCCLYALLHLCDFIKPVLKTLNVVLRGIVFPNSRTRNVFLWHLASIFISTWPSWNWGQWNNISAVQQSNQKQWEKMVSTEAQLFFVFIIVIISNVAYLVRDSRSFSYMSWSCMEQSKMKTSTSTLRFHRVWKARSKQNMTAGASLAPNAQRMRSIIKNQK